MVTVRVRDYIDRAYNSNDGVIINKVLMKEMNDYKEVALSFDGIGFVSSSFVNTALIPLLDFFTFEQIKKSVRFVSTNEQINDMIKSRFVFETKRAQHATTCAA